MTGEYGPPPANPPGLTQIAYRVADFAAFRRALLTPLTGEQQLASWSPGPGDLGLQVLEWWAYLGDVLTFYNERIANNSYLQTAAAQPGPQNTAGLARLLGYRTAPATTATGFIAAIRSASARDGKLAIPAGLQVTSTPTAEAPAQLFEVTDNGEFPGPTDAIIGLPPDPALFQSLTGGAADGAASPGTVLLAGQVTVPPGEQLVLVKRGWDGTTGEWAVATAASSVAETEPDSGRNTRLTLNSGDWHALATNAPQASDYRLQRALATALLFTIQPSGGAQAAGPTLNVPLATLVRNVSPGDNVLFTWPADGPPPRTVQLVAQVTSVSDQVTRVPPPPGGSTLGRAPLPDVYISHTNLTIRTAGADADLSGLRSALGTQAASGIVMRYGLRDVGDLIPTPAKVLDQFPVTVAVPPVLPVLGRTAALADANGAGLMVTAAVTDVPGSVVLTPADGGSGAPGPSLNASGPSLTAPVRLLTALTAVSRGTTVPSEILGDGDPTAASQAFVLQHAPLIYLPPADDPVSTLSVSVNGVPWTEVYAFSGQAPDARVYAVSELPDGSVQVRFGDGINGARLPLGSGNVTATYRYGSPATAPSAGSLTTVLQPQPNLATVLNPLPIIPGTDPEPGETTAQDAPATVIMFSGATSAAAPLISLDDAERLAATVTGVTRVRAYWTWDRERRCPAITVYLSSETDTTAAVTAVNELFPQGAARFPLHAAAARSVELAVSCQLLCPPDTVPDAVQEAAVTALTGDAGLFSPGRMGIGQRLYRSQVEAALMVGGVVAVFGLHVHLAGPGDGPDELVLDPGQDGYFSLPAAGLSISVVIR
jgi:hypothetical protein